jgi:hypothetical protein
MLYKLTKIKLLIMLGCLILFIPFMAIAKTTAASTSAGIMPSVLEPTRYPEGQKLYDNYPWSFLYYVGITGSDPFIRMARGNFHRWPEYIQSVELAYTLNEENIVRRFFSPLVGVVQWGGVVTLRNGRNEHTIYEFSPYIGFRWANFPWNKYIVTSFEAGEGVSYASSIPSVEKRENDNTKRLLNYMMLEATVAAPSYPRWQLVLRVHHRSGAYGLYHAGNTGSNNIGLGIRYLFD